MLTSKLRFFYKNSSIANQSRHFNFAKNKKWDHVKGDDQYTAHSPLHLSRFKGEELRSRIFYEHPPVPHRYAKYFMLFCMITTFSTGVKDKIIKRYKM